MKNKRVLPYVALAVGVMALSLSAMFIRWADAPGPVTAFYRMSLSAAILAPVFLSRVRSSAAIRTSHVVFPLLAGLFTGLDLGLWTSALDFTTAANATLLGNTSPLWVALGSWLLFREKLSRNFWIGLGLALTGAVLIMSTDFILHPRFGIGDMMATFTGFFYGCFFLVTQRSREKFDSLSHVWITGLSASLTLLLINVALGYSITGYSTQTWIVFFSTALVSQLIGYLALAYALGLLPARIVAPTMILQPVLTTILAIPLLDEIPSLWQVAGGLIALCGIYLVNRSHNRPEQEFPNA